MRTLCSTILAFTLIGSLFAEEGVESYAASNDQVAIFITKTNSPPQSNCKHATDPYFEGYLQALVDTSYMDSHVKVIVKDRKVYLANLPTDQRNKISIMNFIKDVPGVDDDEVYELEGVPPEEQELRECYVRRPQIKGVWFPQMTELFQPLIGDPRTVTNLIGYRAGDEVIGKKTVNIALGDDFGVYRWIDAFLHGDLQIGLEGGIWSVFNMDPNPNPDGGTELVNTDFYFGIPITYARGKWSFRLRAYHISGHLGDEYIVNHLPNVTRVNPSVEAIDFSASWQVVRPLRLYVVPGAYVHSDPTYKWQPMYIEYGTEVRFLNHKFYSQRLHGDLFIALHWRNLQQLDWNFDGTYRLGYELSKLQGVGRKLRAWVGYHHGYSFEGQFAKERTKYWEFDLNYGF